VSHVEQELSTLPEHPNSLPVFSGVHVAWSLVFCVMFCRLLFVLWFFYFQNYIIFWNHIYIDNIQVKLEFEASDVYYTTGFQAGPYFPNFPYFLTAALIFCYMWCPTRFPFQLMFLSFNSNRTGVACGAGTVYPSGAPEFTPGF
jgi:hypothetical protein